MEATIKYETCEELYTDDQQESANMTGMHGQYYGERTNSHSQQQQLQHQEQQTPQHPHQRLAHTQPPLPQQTQLHPTHQSHHRQPIPSDTTRQRPTHPDFAHLRQSNTVVSHTRQAAAELSHSRLTNSEHSQARQAHSQSSHSRQAGHHQPPHHQQQNHQYPNTAMKRSYHDIENGYTGATNPAALSAAAPAMTADNGAYYAGQGLINVAPHTQNFDLFNHTYPSYDAPNNPLAPATIDGKSPKRYKKGEASLLFSPPFFKILPLPYQLAGMVSPNHKDAIAAQCYACGRIVRGNKSISSNFIKHMKRSHPEISKIYDTYKIFRIKAGIMPNITSLLDVKMEKGSSMVEESAAPPDEAGDSNDETSPYFDPTTMLDVSEMIEEDNHSENSENADDSMPSGEPSENNEHSKDHHQQQQAAKEPEESATNEISDKLMEAISKMMDSKLKQFVKLSDLPKLTADIKDTSTGENISLPSNHPDVEDLKKQMDQLKQECVVLRLAVQQSQASKRRLQKELQIVDKMLHQKKLIIRHLKLDNPCDPQQTVHKLFTERLGLENIDITKCSIIPTTKSLTPGSNKECVIVELKNPRNSKAILRETHKLKDTGIFIEPEISPFQRKRKNKLMVLRKELLRRQPELKVLVRNTTLVVNSKNFYWDDVEGLCFTGNSSDALELSGIEYLKTLTELDLTEFITILKNYDVQLKE